MEQSVILLNNKFEVIDEFDNYISLIWCERFIEIGAVDLEIEASKENLELFQIGYFLYRKEDNSIYRINSRELSAEEDKDDTLVIGAVDLRGITKQLTVQGQLDGSRTYNAEEWIREAMLAFTAEDSTALPKAQYPNFVIDKFSLGASHGYSETTYLFDEKDKKLDEHIIYLCTLLDMGWRILYEDNKLVFDLYKGEDRTIFQDKNPRVLFSPDYENLQTMKYSELTDKLATVAVVTHENASTVGDNGLVYAYDTKEEPKGLDRFDLIVDGSKIAMDGTTPDDIVTYTEKLRALGLAKLRQHTKTRKFESEVFLKQFVYREDYFLGDIVTVENSYGIRTNARIIEIIETWDKEGYSMEPVFEYLGIDDTILNAILTEAGEPIMTEADEYLIYEED